MNPNDDLSGLPYVSSAPSLVPRDGPKPIDEAEISTIERLFQMIQRQKAHYTTIHSLDADDNHFTLEEQLYLNEESLRRLNEQESLLQSTITKVREKQNGTNY